MLWTQGKFIPSEKENEYFLLAWERIARTHCTFWIAFVCLFLIFCFFGLIFSILPSSCEEQHHHYYHCRHLHVVLSRQHSAKKCTPWLHHCAFTYTGGSGYHQRDQILSFWNMFHPSEVPPKGPLLIYVVMNKGYKDGRNMHNFRKRAHIQLYIFLKSITVAMLQYNLKPNTDIYLSTIEAEHIMQRFKGTEYMCGLPDLEQKQPRFVCYWAVILYSLYWTHLLK